VKRAPHYPSWTPRPADPAPATQCTLNFEARARATDPATSVHATADVDGAALAAKVLSWLRERGASGGTSHEAAEALGISLVSVSPRFAPLARVGLIRKARMEDGWPIRRKVEGQRCSSQVWVAAEFAAGGGG